MNTAKIFMNGRSQAVRLPQEYRFKGNEVYIRRDEKTGDIILSEKVGSWDEFFALVDAAREEAKDFLIAREVDDLWRERILSRYLKEEITRDEAISSVGIDWVELAERQHKALREDLRWALNP